MIVAVVGAVTTVVVTGNEALAEGKERLGETATALARGETAAAPKAGLPTETASGTLTAGLLLVRKTVTVLPAGICATVTVPVA